MRFPKSRRRPLGAYSVLGIQQTANDRQIKSACRHKRTALEADRRRARSSQAKSRVTKALTDVQLAEETLLFCRHEHDTFFLKALCAASTLRVRRHRAAKTRKQRQAETAKATTRRWAKKGVLTAKLNFQKRGQPSFRRNANSANAMKPGGVWEGYRRSRGLRARDKRLGPWVMVCKA